MKKLFNYSAHINRVIDGDTVDATIDLGFNVKIDVRIRLAGINSPELKSKIIADKEKAVEAKEFLKSKALDKNIKLDSLGKDKYGRWLAIIYLNDENINESITKLGYGVPYLMKK